MNYLVLFFIFAVGISFAEDFHGPIYQQEDASLKSFQLLQASLNDSTSGRWYSFEELELFLESMNLSFSFVGDDMPFQFAGLIRRLKLIHSVGVLGRGSWVADPGSPFTGVLGSGCKNLIIRLSLARQADASTPYTPGLSLKCLRDGVSSGNLFAMYSLSGQDSWNFFKHDLTNHVPDLSSNAAFLLRQLRAKFAEASDYPVMIGLSDLARFSDDGTQHVSPLFPFRLVFHPVSKWHSFYPDNQPSTSFQEQLESTLVPGPLYEIYAKLGPNDDNTQLTHIGRLDLTTTTSTSLFGDTLMFFQHTHMEDDLSYRPDWVGPAKAIMQDQQSQDNYVYPDLPW